MADCFSLLIAGQLLDAVICPFTNVLGSWFYALGLLIIVVMIYFKSNHNLTLVLMIAGLGGSAMTMLLPAIASRVATIILLLVFVGVLYKLATKG